MTAGPELPGKHVVLVPVTAEHVQDLRRILHTPEVRLRWGDEAASPQWPFDDPSATRFAVLLDGAVMGMVQYSEEDEPAYRHASIDVFLDPTVHGRGIGRDAVGSATPTAPGGMTACSWTSSPRNWTSLADSASLSRQRIGQRDGRLLWERSFRYPLRCHRAVEILRRFNAPEGVAHTMAETVADRAASEAATHPSRELVDRFSVHGPRALQRLRQAEATAVGPWPHSGAVVTTGRSTHSPLPVLR